MKKNYKIICFLLILSLQVFSQIEAGDTNSTSQTTKHKFLFAYHFSDYGIGYKYRIIKNLYIGANGIFNNTFSINNKDHTTFSYDFDAAFNMGIGNKFQKNIFYTTPSLNCEYQFNKKRFSSNINLETGIDFTLKEIINLEFYITPFKLNYEEKRLDLTFSVDPRFCLGVVF